MRYYFDTSALAKLVIDEAETDGLSTWLAATRPVIVTNVVGVVELQRAAARVNSEAVGRATRLLARTYQIELTPTTVHRAAQVPPPTVRTLDALHVASAAEVPGLSAVVTYDRRIAAAADDYGLPVISPGAG